MHFTFQMVCQAFWEAQALKGVGVLGLEMLIVCDSCASMGQLACLHVVGCACAVA